MNIEQTEPSTVRRYIPRELDAAITRAAGIRGLTIQEYFSQVVLPFVRNDLESIILTMSVGIDKSEG